MDDEKLSRYLKCLVSAGGSRCVVEMVTDLRQTSVSIPFPTTEDMLKIYVIRFPKLYEDHFPIKSTYHLNRFCQSMTSLLFGIADVVPQCVDLCGDLLEITVQHSAQYFRKVAIRKLKILQNKLPRELCADVLNQIIVDEWQDHCISIHRTVVDSRRMIPGTKLSMQRYFMMSKPIILL